MTATARAGQAEARSLHRPSFFGDNPPGKKRAVRRSHSQGTGRASVLPNQGPLRAVEPPASRSTPSRGQRSTPSRSLATTPTPALRLAGCGGGGSEPRTQPPHPGVSSLGAGLGDQKGAPSPGGARSHFSAPRASSAPAAPGPGQPRLHDAGYLHPDAVCHHRPGRPVLHHLPALGARSRGPICQDGAQGRAPRADAGRVLLRSLFRVLVQKQVSGLQPHRRPLIRHPAAPQDPFGRPPAAARLWPTRRRSAGTAGTRVVADGRAARKELRMARDENTES